MDSKENYPLKRTNHSRRFSYCQPLPQQNIGPNSQHSPHEYNKNIDKIAELQQKLKQQQLKYKKLEETTIREQMNVLEQVNLLEDRFNQVTKEKQYYQKQIEQYKDNIVEYKKIKGVSQAMIKMMGKVEGKTGDLHETWQWVKKVVTDFETIKKKALEWKTGYDAFMALSDCTQSDNLLIQRNQTFSDSSDSFGFNS